MPVHLAHVFAITAPNCLFLFIFPFPKQFPITALREIRILQLLKHENVVNLIEICRTKAAANNRYRSTFYLVFEFCEHDLAGLLSNLNVKFSLGEIKKVSQQLLNGLYYIHSNKVSDSSRSTNLNSNARHD